MQNNPEIQSRSSKRATRRSEPRLKKGYAKCKAPRIRRISRRGCGRQRWTRSRVQEGCRARGRGGCGRTRHSASRGTGSSSRCSRRDAAAVRSRDECRCRSPPASAGPWRDPRRAPDLLRCSARCSALPRFQPPYGVARTKAYRPTSLWSDDLQKQYIGVKYVRIRSGKTLIRRLKQAHTLKIFLDRTLRYLSKIHLDLSSCHNILRRKQELNNAGNNLLACDDRRCAASCWKIDN